MISLRALTELDITDEYLSWFKDSSTNFFLDAKNISHAEATAYLNMGESTGTYHMFAIEVNASHEHIGNLKIGPINLDSKVSDLVTVIGKSEWRGKGLGAKAIGLGSDLAFEKFDIRKLAGEINASNRSSLNAYLAAGWFVEGVLRDHEVRGGKISDLYCVAKFHPQMGWPSVNGQ